jgi:alpha-glucosidase
MAQVVNNYTLLTGKTNLPQLWTLGNQQSRWSYASEDEVRLIVENFKKYRIPLDVIHLDIDYMDNYKIFTTSKTNFPHFQDLIIKLKEQGIKVVTILDPGVKVEAGYEIFEEGTKNNYFATYQDKVYVNRVWPGDAVYPSFLSSKVQNWWKEKVKFLIDFGVRGIWDDMNEPASFDGPLPDDVIFDSENKKYLHKEVHNVYGHLMAKATYEGLKNYDKRRPYVITRACYSGTQKYSTVWTGDNHSIWAHLQMAIPQLCNLGLSGVPFSGTDIGGFSSDTTKELLLRWLEASLFAPLFRNHSASGTRRQEPWTFDEETINIYRKTVETRYEFISYIYDLFYEHQKNGAPIIRPLVYHYSDDIMTHNLNDEYLNHLIHLL